VSAVNTWRRIVAACLGIIVGVATHADAGQLTVYNSQSSFDAATTGLKDVNFNGIVGPTSFIDYAIPPGYTDPATGTNFTFNSGLDINITGRNYYSPTDFPDDFLVASTSVQDSASEIITLPTSETAVGLMFSTFSAATFVFTLSNGDSYTDAATPSLGNVAFLGFTDTSAFSSLTISVPSGNDTTILLDFQYGTAVPGTTVPEPTSLALLGMGCLTFIGYMWRAVIRLRVRLEVGHLAP
jgi:hypothetical protein